MSVYIPCFCLFLLTIHSCTYFLPLTSDLHSHLTHLQFRIYTCIHMLPDTNISRSKMNINFLIALKTIMTMTGSALAAEEAHPKLGTHDSLIDSQSVGVDVSWPWPLTSWCDEDKERCGADMPDGGTGLLDQGCYNKNVIPQEYDIYDDVGNDCCDSDKFMGNPIEGAIGKREYFCVSCWPDGWLCGYDGWTGSEFFSFLMKQVYPKHSHITYNRFWVLQTF